MAVPRPLPAGPALRGEGDFLTTLEASNSFAASLPSGGFHSTSIQLAPVLPLPAPLPCSSCHFCFFPAPCFFTTCLGCLPFFPRPKPPRFGTQASSASPR